MARRVAGWLTELAANSPGRFAIGLSGGSTPRRLYQLLAEAPSAIRLPWDRLHWFWGDERFVPWDHPDSNYGMVRAAMLARSPAPATNIHGVVTTAGTPADAARNYEGALQSYYGSASLDPDQPLFDVQLLGLGEDGHTASLIPGTSALEERSRWAVEVIGARPEPRITLTYPAAREQPTCRLSRRRSWQAGDPGSRAGRRSGAAGRAGFPGRRSDLVR